MVHHNQALGDVTKGLDVLNCVYELTLLHFKD